MSRRRLPTLLDAHRAALSACRQCGHADARVLPIISEAVRPRVMLVGQAPGKSELTDRRAFTGRAGRTLFRWLERAGLDEATFRREVYIAAITRCYPGPSASGRGDRVPSLEEQARCAPWLEAELDLIRPEVIIPVGRLAIDRFLDTEPLDRLVGVMHATRVRGRSVRVLPLPHPSGASSWVNAPANRALLDRALDHLAQAFAGLGIGARQTSRRTA
ncbi:MAG: uracil-DNA glycosylase [Gemmatimonadaceae bacterium]